MSGEMRSAFALVLPICWIVTGCFGTPKQDPAVAISVPAIGRPVMPGVLRRPLPPVRVIPVPDLSGADKNATGLTERPEEENSPDVVVEILETFRKTDTYELILNYVNRSPLPGNKSIDVIHYDSLGRVVDVSSRVIFFRGHQQFMERITVPALSGAVRWVVRAT